jgi:DNA-binding transcriptional ArsR family regulator
MPRKTAVNDVFHSIAPRPRRQIIELLARRRQVAVGALVLALGLPQPAVSKHLGALRAVGIVSVSKQGQQRMYALNYDQLRPIFDWIKLFERHWERQLDRIAARAEARATALSKISKIVSSESPNQKGSS